MIISRTNTIVNGLLMVLEVLVFSAANVVVLNFIIGLFVLAGLDNCASKVCR